jgi:hypothetical protein
VARGDKVHKPMARFKEIVNKKLNLKMDCSENFSSGILENN